MALIKSSNPPRIIVIIFACLFVVGLIGKTIAVRLYSVATVRMGGQEFSARVASSGAQREKGLSGTDSLGKNEAMVFKFDSARQYVFWMKDMNYALDIIWVQNGKIIDIAPRVPPGIGLQDVDLPKYAPRLPASRVVEVVAGTADRLGIKIGDAVQIVEK